MTRVAPRSPLPQHGGLDAAWVRSPGAADAAAAGWATVGDFLAARLPARAEVARRLAAGEFADDAGAPLTGNEPFRPHTIVWFHRPLAPEVEVPFDIPALHRDDRVVVVDKPHFLATTPRGEHVTQTALVRLRLELGLSELAPAHRLDRLTAGVLLFTTRREWRGAYQGLFQSGGARKEYEALVHLTAGAALPPTLVGRIEKRRGSLVAELVEGSPNAVTDVEVVERWDAEALARVRLTPRTGKTHQLRLQLTAAGAPIVGDPLYPVIREVAPGDFSTPLRLIARRLAFVDPVDGQAREFVSERVLETP